MPVDGEQQSEGDRDEFQREIDELIDAERVVLDELDE